MHSVNFGGAWVFRLDNDKLLMMDFVGRKRGPLVANAGRRVRGKRVDAQPHDTGAAQVLFDGAQQPGGNPLPSKGGHDTDVGDVSKPVGVGRLGNNLSHLDPSDDETDKGALAFRHEHCASGGIGLAL
jgi:hypothetical protein